MSSKDAYNKVEELIKKCEKCETEELRNECKQYSNSISIGINNVYKSAQYCEQSIVNDLHLLGKFFGELSLFTRKYLDKKLMYEIEDILVEIRKIVYNDIGQLLQEKCKCRLR
jgi:hypothetical protein